MSKATSQVLGVIMRVYSGEPITSDTAAAASSFA
jgi:hypothetical protein